MARGLHGLPDRRPGVPAGRRTRKLGPPPRVRPLGQGRRRDRRAGELLRSCPAVPRRAPDRDRDRRSRRRVSPRRRDGPADPPDLHPRDRPGRRLVAGRKPRRVFVPPAEGRAVRDLQQDRERGRAGARAPRDPRRGSRRGGLGDATDDSSPTRRTFRTRTAGSRSCRFPTARNPRPRWPSTTGTRQAPRFPPIRAGSRTIVRLGSAVDRRLSPPGAGRKMAGHVRGLQSEMARRRPRAFLSVPRPDAHGGAGRRDRCGVPRRRGHPALPHARFLEPRLFLRRHARRPEIYRQQRRQRRRARDHARAELAGGAPKVQDRRPPQSGAGPALPESADWISATIASAISAAVSAPMFSPAGERTRPAADSAPQAASRRLVRSRGPSTPR